MAHRAHPPARSNCDPGGEGSRRAGGDGRGRVGAAPPGAGLADAHRPVRSGHAVPAAGRPAGGRGGARAPGQRQGARPCAEPGRVPHGAPGAGDAAGARLHRGGPQRRGRSVRRGAGSAAGALVHGGAAVLGRALLRRADAGPLRVRDVPADRGGPGGGVRPAAGHRAAERGAARRLRAAAPPGPRARQAAGVAAGRRRPRASWRRA